MPVSSHAANSGSQWPEWIVGRPSLSGASENVTALKPAFGVAPDLLRRDLRIAEVRDLVRDEAVGVRAAPRLEVPVVVRADRGERELVGVGPHREPLADEAGQERREAQRRVHAVDVHVGDARVHVPRAAAHLVEARRLEAVLARRPADDRVEPDVGELLALPHPRLAAVVGGDDARLVVGELLREAAGERVGRLHHVVVDGDDRVRALARLGLGQPGDLFSATLAPAERLARREVVERHVHSSTSGSCAMSMRTAPSQYARPVTSFSNFFNGAARSGEISTGVRPAARMS